MKITGKGTIRCMLRITVMGTIMGVVRITVMCTVSSMMRIAIKFTYEYDKKYSEDYTIVICENYL